MTILLAEDEHDVRDLFADFLESRGHDVLAAADGPSALERSRSHHGPIDLLLTDIVMPDMNGVELACQVQRERPGVQIIFMSGYAPRHAEIGRCSAAATFLAKPFSLDTLAAALDTPAAA